MTTQSTIPPRAPLSMPKLFLHSEGLTMFVAGIVLYAQTGGNWLMFIVLLLAPDLAMLSYLANKRVGAITYDLAHHLLVPAILIVLGSATGTVILTHIGLIWLAHIGMDRTVGYGFKYATNFKDTHLQRV